MFACVCLCIWKWGYFILAKDSQEICMSLALYPCSFLICVMMRATSPYCIDRILFSSLIAWFFWLPGNCIDTDHFRAYYTPKPKIQLIQNDIGPMAFAEDFPWHWKLTLKAGTSATLGFGDYCSWHFSLWKRKKLPCDCILLFQACAPHSIFTIYWYPFWG